MAFDSRSLTEDRYAARTERTIRDMGFGATDGALAIVNRYLNDIHKVIVETLNDNTKTHKTIREAITDIDSEVLSLLSIQITLGCVASCKTLSQTTYELGKHVEQEAYAVGLKKHDGRLLSRIEAKVRKRHGSLKYRKQAFRSAAKRAGYKFSGWSGEERFRVGTWLLGCVLTEGSPFVLCESEAQGPYVTITEEALSISDRMVTEMMNRRPILLPSLSKPEDWTTSQMTIDGYRVDLVRKHDKFTQSVIRAAISDGRLGRVLEALNAAQSVSYRVNEPILAAIKWCYERGVEVDGLPPSRDVDIPRPDQEWDTLTPDEQKVWRKRISDTKDLNRSFIGQRLTLERDLATADYLGSKPFWTVLNLDYRGRVYGVPSFNFQRQDYVRSLFLFSEGKPLGKDGLYWLKVHVANTGDFGKVSKRPFDERVKWVDDNLDHIMKAANDPFRRYLNQDPWWLSADKPFMFLAACMELRDAYDAKGGPTAYESSLPISFDGSCSGLQHLCAMTRAEEGILVNLGPTEQPQDVYQVVADLVSNRVKQDLDDPRFGFLAERAMAYGINRGLVKRNVMTYSYSSKKFGMAQQQLEDTMKPLEYKVLAGELKEHPFGADNGYSASRYLASVVYDAIEAVVSKPAEAMRFLQQIARTLAHEGKPLIWHTPLGFPVVLRYPVENIKRLSLWLYDKGVKVRYMPRFQDEQPASGIDKTRAANAVAPSFVHSMDACHLHLVCLAASKEGMSLALVHDSFGCHAADAERFRTLIKEEFIYLYAHDVLRLILEEAGLQVSTNHHRLPELPKYGRLDLDEVMNADYAFA